MFKSKKPINPNLKKEIRILYKKVGKTPIVKTIDIYKLKKFIVKNKLDIIQYEKLFIICYSKKNSIGMKPNIYLPLRCIAGDFMVANINKKRREFISLSQEDIIDYSQDLINKSPKSKNIIISQICRNNINDNYERGFEDERFNKYSNFERTLINILTDIELILSKISKRNSGGDKN